MIYKRYGSAYQSVEVDFDARAMTEIGFRRDRKNSIPVEDIESSWDRVDERALTATAEGPVQYEAESAVLEALREQLDAYMSELGSGEILLLESEAGADYPKLREKRDDVLVEGRNAFYFRWSVDPPLRVARYRKRA